MICLDVELFNFTCAVASHITDETFVKYGVLLEVAGCKEPDVHDEVVGVLVVAQDLEQMLLGLIFGDLGKLLQGIEQCVVKVFDHNFIIACIYHQVFFALFYYFYQLVVVRLIVFEDQVLEQLEKECPIEAVTIASQSPHPLILRIKNIKAVLKLIMGVLLL